MWFGIWLALGTPPPFVLLAASPSAPPPLPAQLSLGGKLALAFGSLMGKLWQGGVASVSPKLFKWQVGDRSFFCTNVWLNLRAFAACCRMRSAARVHEESFGLALTSNSHAQSLHRSWPSLRLSSAATRSRTARSCWPSCWTACMRCALCCVVPCCAVIVQGRRCTLSQPCPRMPACEL